jgi:hypothetical protein
MENDVLLSWKSLGEEGSENLLSWVVIREEEKFQLLSKQYIISW